jgi:hypothetical protein
MWSATSTQLSENQGLRFELQLNARPATVSEVIGAWRDDASFRTLFNALLVDAPYRGFRWETPPVTASTLARHFEFVLLDSPRLVRRPEPQAFAEHFTNSPSGVAVFPNLGGDAIMIVPCPLAEPSAYGHLAAFVRLAPEAQRHALWQTVGDAMAQRVGPKPLWLSTAGAGVSWLHVRLDDQPKYYGFDPYRRLTRDG